MRKHGSLIVKIAIGLLVIFVSISRSTMAYSEEVSGENYITPIIENEELFSKVNYEDSVRETIEKKDSSTEIYGGRYEPGNYKLINSYEYADILYDSYGSWQWIYFENIYDYSSYQMDLIVQIESDYYYSKDSIVTLEFFKEVDGWLEYYGNTEFNTYGFRYNTLHSLVDKSDFEDQEYIYIRLGLRDSIYNNYYSDITLFKVKNPFYLDTVQNGWQFDGYYWTYYKNGRKVSEDWIYDNGNWYYFDFGGVMCANKTYQIDTDIYIFDENGHTVKKNGWYTQYNIGYENFVWYYLNGDGTLKTGWLNDDGVWYYLDYFGVMQTGWVSDGFDWYYFNNSGGMQTGWLNDGFNWYYLNASGVMQTGWLNDGFDWYYLNNSGGMQTGWLNDGFNWYYLNASGVMQIGWISDGFDWYYLDNAGIMQTGWLNNGFNWYYMYNNGVMATNIVIDGWGIGSDGIAFPI